MTETNTTKRGELFRNAVVFQLKLMADGFRDLVLLPVSLIATLIGLLRGGDEPEREFNRVLDLGRDTEKWIDLFGQHIGTDDAHAISSIDTLVTRVEETLKQQYKAEGTSERVQAQIEGALKAVQNKARKNNRLTNEEPNPNKPGNQS